MRIDDPCKAIATVGLPNCKVADMIVSYDRMVLTVDKDIKNRLEDLVDEVRTGSTSTM